jgi:1,2-diacylglycerol 3-alpha-glucosyltransferase
MKILIAAESYYPNTDGASYSAHRLAQSLKSKGHAVMAVAPSKTLRTGLEMRDGISVFGVRSYPILVYKNFRISPPVFTKKSIEKAVRDFDPDVIHIQSHFFVCEQVFRVAKKMGVPIVGTNHFMPENLIHYFPVPKSWKKGLKNSAWRKFKSVYEKLDIVTTPTVTAAKLAKGIGLDKEIIPVSNGIDLSRFKPQNEGEYLRDKYALGRDPIFLYVGRLDKEKNLDKILKALALVPKEMEFRFAIAGKGAEGARLKKITKGLRLEKRVVFLGFVPDEDLPNLYPLADCFIIAGMAELQSIVTMEAMASGLPVLAVNAVALPELVHHGENGFLFEINELKQIADYIVKIISDQDIRKEMSQKSLDIIKEHDIIEVISKFESFYEELIEKNEKNHSES